MDIFLYVCLDVGPVYLLPVVFVNTSTLQVRANPNTSPHPFPPRLVHLLQTDEPTDTSLSHRNPTLD